MPAFLWGALLHCALDAAANYFLFPGKLIILKKWAVLGGINEVRCLHGDLLISLDEIGCCQIKL